MHNLPAIWVLAVMIATPSGSMVERIGIYKTKTVCQHHLSTMQKRGYTASCVECDVLEINS